MIKLVETLQKMFRERRPDVFAYHNVLVKGYNAAIQELVTLAQSSSFKDHHGSHAYRHLVSICLGMPSEVMLTYYSNINFPEPIDPNIWHQRCSLIVQIIQDFYAIELTDLDKDWILNEMKSPKQFLIDFGDRFSPTNYPQLTHDIPVKTV